MAQTLEEIAQALPDRFRVERRIGSGGWAVVYLAHDTKHDRPVAVKVLRSDLASVVGERRFAREIQVAAQLSHPNILPLHDSGQRDDLLYYVMPFVEGESLRHRLDREGALPIHEAVRIAREVADALAYAHEHGVVHRDIKPANILLESGHAVVADFGIAAVTQAVDPERLTDSGESPGTPRYMSPEQIDGDAIDGRSDIYSLGCVLYEMLAGEPPFSGLTSQMVLARKLVGSPPPLRALREAVPEELEVIVARTLERVPADRYRSVSELAEALARTRSLIPVPGELRPGRTVPEKVARAAAAGLLGVLGTGAIGYLTTVAFENKLQIPEELGGFRAEHLVIGFQALIPVIVFGLLAAALLVFLRRLLPGVAATITRVPGLGPRTRTLGRVLAKRGRATVGSTEPEALGDLFFVGGLAISFFTVSRFSDLLAVLWTTDTAALACARRPLYWAYHLVLPAMIVGFGTAWFELFRRLKPRARKPARLAFARWGSLAWIVMLLLVLTVPWRIFNAYGERVRIDGERAYVLEESPTELLAYFPGTRAGVIQDLTAELDIVRLGLSGYAFEEPEVFESGVPECLSVTDPERRVQ